ncbi:Helix-turn-helix domain-containing protein [Chitinophaga sp. CF118]|uniref:helix-turn-helix domain-containing protein n=1 Tax=Chitinophaga sp. CF118 TaxID=1884367 RepID=UPI0008ED5C64|nr:AraC family transcriptional regulator [Chitinophaga sp. CF118]SFE84297.1 Helix-turn-helix domain-containing protein [Chitinophaga sp. CF118]
MELTFFCNSEQDSISYPLPQSITNEIQTGLNGVHKSGCFGEVLLHETSGDYASTWFKRYVITQKTALQCKSDQPLLSLQINRNVPYTLSINGMGNVSFLQEQYNMLYLPQTDITSVLKQGIYTTVEIHYELGYLQKWHEHIPLLDKLLTSIEKNIPAKLTKENSNATPQILNILHEMENCAFVNDLRIMYMEAKALEFLSLCLHRAGNLIQTGSIETLKPHHIEKLHHAKTYLSQHIDTPVSINEVARKVGMNDYMLKRGFKQLFGMAMYDYLIEIRMKEARQLLLDSDHHIGEIAYKIGYSSISNFSTAFKKKYGYPPSAIKRKG